MYIYTCMLEKRENFYLIYKKIKVLQKFIEIKKKNTQDNNKNNKNNKRRLYTYLVLNKNY